MSLEQTKLVALLAEAITTQAPDARFSERGGFWVPGGVTPQTAGCYLDLEMIASDILDAARQEGARGGEPVEHAPDCQSHIVDVRGRPDECTCGAVASPAEPSGWKPIAEAVETASAYISVRTEAAYRFQPYKPDGARQMKKPGRWQTFNGYGWENAPLPETGDFRPLPPTSEGGGA